MNLESLFKYFPSYFSDFVALAGAPKKFLISRASEEDTKAASQNSIIFLFVSFIISLLIIVFATDDTSSIDGFVSKDATFLTKFLARGAVYLLWVILIVVVMRIAYRIVGGKAELSRSFIGLNYILGMLMVFNAVIEFAGNGIANLDPQVAKTNVILNKEAKSMEGKMYDLAEMSNNPAAVDSAKLRETGIMLNHGVKASSIIINSKTTWLAAGVQLVCYIFAGIWLLLGLGFFRHINEVPASKNILALVLAAFGFFIVSLLGDMISGGNNMQKAMREKYANDTTATLASLAAEVDARNGQPATTQASPVNTTNTGTTTAVPASESPSDPVKTYSGTIGGRGYTYAITQQAQNTISGYLYAPDSPNEKYSFVLLYDGNEAGIVIKDAQENIIGAADLVLNANNCYEGNLGQTNGSTQHMVICE